jgi:hypothetical protein
MELPMKWLVLLAAMATALDGCNDAYNDAWRRTYNKASYGPHVGPAVSAMQDEIARVKAARVKPAKP